MERLKEDGNKTKMVNFFYAVQRRNNHRKQVHAGMLFPVRFF